MQITILLNNDGGFTVLLRGYLLEQNRNNLAWVSCKIHIGKVISVSFFS